MHAAGGQTSVAKTFAGTAPSEGSTTRAKGRIANGREMAISKTTLGVAEITSKVSEMLSRGEESRAAKAISESRYASDAVFAEMSENGPVLGGRAMAASCAPCPYGAGEAVAASASGVPKGGRVIATVVTVRPSISGNVTPTGPMEQESLKMRVSPILRPFMFSGGIRAGPKNGLLCCASEKVTTAVASLTSLGSQTRVRPTNENLVSTVRGCRNGIF